MKEKEERDDFYDVELEKTIDLTEIVEEIQQND